MRSKEAFNADFIQAAKNYNIVALDIGARDGFDQNLSSIGAAVSMIGFEPEPGEASRLQTQSDSTWESLKIIAKAVGERNGADRLYVPPSKAGASLLPHNSLMLEKFGYEGLHGVGSICEVETVTLDKLLADEELSKVSYLKVDVEGAELAVLRGGERLLHDTLAMKIEVSFLEQRVGQPLIWEVVDWMRERGFACIDVIDVHRWRRRPVPAHPYRSKYYVPYSKGRVAQCDLIFFKRPEMLGSDDQKIEYALISAALGYFDEAIGTIKENPSIGELWSERHGFGLEGALINESRKRGNITAWTNLAKKIRLLVPSFRSALFGLPFEKPRRPY